MTAVYEETLEGGRPIQRLVVADVQNPLNYRVLWKAGKSAERPCFGPEKKRLLFENYKGALTGSDGVITLLDLESGEVRPLVDSTEGGRRPIQGKLGACVWSANGSGFYYTAYAGGGFAYPAYYDLEEGKTISPFPQTNDVVFAKARMGRDTLVVRTGNEECQEAWDKEEEFQCSPFFLMTPKGQYISHLNSPYFTLTQKQGIYNLDWNDELKLFALTYNDTTSTGWKIAVTNLDGSYWVATSGQYADGLPSWGPNGQFVLFDRRGRRELAYTAHEVMRLEPKSGTVRELVEPGKIDGAVALRQPDY
jgi:Tol biopolymer transport system component